MRKEVELDDRPKMNHHLKTHGLGGLEDPDLIHQLGFMVKDHEHFGKVLRAVIPEQRNTAYEAMRPYLRFKPWPLDRYLII